MLLPQCPTYREDGQLTAGFQCSHCLQWATQSGWEKWLTKPHHPFICACGKTLAGGGGTINPSTTNLGVRENDYHMYLSGDTIHDQKWYHATQRKNWLKNIRVESGKPPFYPHVGSLETVQEFILQRELGVSYVGIGGSWILYEVSINEDATLQTGPACGDEVDEGGWARRMRRERKDVVRYVNLYESPGSISLVARPSALKINSKVELKDFDPWSSLLSDYLVRS